MRRFGLIGRPLGHSASAAYFAAKFEREGIADCTYTLYELPEIGALERLLAETPDLCGFNVTIPYKREVMALLDDLSHDARLVGAVNCVRRTADSRLVGHNTDVIGLRAAFDCLLGGEQPSHALVLGTGGASQAVQYVLAERGIPFDLVSRDAAKGNYTVQYDVTYLAASKPDRYVVLLTNYNGFDSYNSCHIRAQGSGNNQNRFLGTWSNYDIKGPYYAGTTAESDEASSIAKKVFGQDIDTSVGVMYNKSVTIRIQCNYAEGPSCYMRDNSVPGSDFVLVSKPDSTANGFQYWNMIDNYAICLKVGGKIDSYVDNISIWSGLGNEPLDTSDTAYKAAIADYLKQVEAQQ